MHTIQDNLEDPLDGAVCRSFSNAQVDQHWFAPDSARCRDEPIMVAVEACLSCPVLDACHEMTIALDAASPFEPFGVSGGMRQAERRRLRRQHRSQHDLAGNTKNWVRV